MPRGSGSYVRAPSVDNSASRCASYAKPHRVGFEAVKSRIGNPLRRRASSARDHAVSSLAHSVLAANRIVRTTLPQFISAIHNREVTTSAPPTTATVPLAVIFDFGRVLSMQPDADAHTALVATAGVPDEVFEEHYWAHRHAYDAGTLNGQTYWQKVAKGAGFPLTPERLAAFHHHDSLMWANLNAPMLEWAFAFRRQASRPPFSPTWGT